MRMATNWGAVTALVSALGLGLAACLPQGTATSIATDIAADDAETRPVSWLARPEGDGPFPAVVLMHGCGGTERNTQHQTVWRGLGRHAALLNENGYVTLVVDSFGSRGITDGCQAGARYYPLQASDAHAAFDYLAAQTFVDGERIGLVGLSLGGGTALQLALKSSVDRRAKRNRRTYAALVAYYPWCEPAWASSLYRPVLILIGAEDDWTPAWRCSTLRKLAEKAWNEPSLELEVYANAHHSFDLPMRGPYFVEGLPGEFHTVQGDDKARRESQARMLAFFKKYLGESHADEPAGGDDVVAHLGMTDLQRFTAVALAQ